jgi:hypothetical protein
LRIVRKTGSTFPHDALETWAEKEERRARENRPDYEPTNKPASS